MRDYTLNIQISLERVRIFSSCFVNKNPTYNESNLKWFMPHFKFFLSTTEYNLDPVLNSTATANCHQIIGDYSLYLQLDIFVLCLSRRYKLRYSRGNTLFVKVAVNIPLPLKHSREMTSVCKKNRLILSGVCHMYLTSIVLILLD